MLKETETEETICFFVTFLSLVSFQLGGKELGPPLGYVYDQYRFFFLHINKYLCKLVFVAHRVLPYNKLNRVY